MKVWENIALDLDMVLTNAIIKVCCQNIFQFSYVACFEPLMKILVTMQVSVFGDPIVSEVARI